MPSLCQRLDQPDHSPVVQDELNVALQNTRQHIPIFVLVSKPEVLVFLSPSFLLNRLSLLTDAWAALWGARPLLDGGLRG